MEVLTLMPYCWLGCGFVLLWTIISFHWIEIMDKILNYSMKKKVKTKKIPLWFPSDRKNESASGPSLEQPNEGTYLPAFIFSIIAYSICVVSIVTLITVHFVVRDDSVDLYLMIGVVVASILEIITVRLLIEHYERKYFNNQPYYIDKIRAIINGESDNSDNK